MRGKACFVVYARYVLRITPAYAGKSIQEKDVQQDGRDHPRVCGEKA